MRYFQRGSPQYGGSLNTTLTTRKEELEIAGLTEKTEYGFQVRAKTSQKWGDFTPAVYQVRFCRQESFFCSGKDKGLYIGKAPPPPRGKEKISAHVIWGKRKKRGREKEENARQIGGKGKEERKRKKEKEKEKIRCKRVK